MKHKSIQIKSEAVQDDGFFIGYGSVFDVKDSYGDIVRKGAFETSIESGIMPKLLWQHDPSKVIGVWEKIEEDDHGLKMQGRLFIDDIAQAKEAHVLLKHGAVDGLSIGYTINKGKWNEDDDAYDLLSLDLMETSIVTFPANEAATVSEVKTALNKGELPSLKDFEKFLRESGFSKSQSTAIASRGLKPLLGEPAEKQEISETLEIIKSIRSK